MREELEIISLSYLISDYRNNSTQRVDDSLPKQTLFCKSITWLELTRAADIILKKKEERNCISIFHRKCAA